MTKILIIGRSPTVLVDAVARLRARGYDADATNQYNRVSDDYDLSELSVAVFGGFVPPDTKQELRERISAANPNASIVQGLAGMPGVIVAQVEAAIGATPRTMATYDPVRRVVEFGLDRATTVEITAIWGTSFAPPEPTSTERQVFAAELAAGVHAVPLPRDVPDEASFAAVAGDGWTQVLQIGPMPAAITSAIARGGAAELPPVRSVTTRGGLEVTHV